MIQNELLKNIKLCITLFKPSSLFKPSLEIYVGTRYGWGMGKGHVG